MTNYVERIEKRHRMVQDLRIKLKLTTMSQTDIAFKSGISRTTLWNISNHRTLSSIKVINKIEEVLLND